MATFRDVVRQVVATTAPHELALLDTFDGLDDGELSAVLARTTRASDPVAFGVTEVAVLVAPVAWLVVSEVVTRGTGLVADSVFARARALLRRWVRRRRRRPAPTTVPSLTREQLVAVHERTLTLAAQAGIDQPLAGQLADAVVSALARGAQP